MATKTVDELRAKTDAAWANLSRQLQGMDAHLDQADAPGEWTTRQVLCHLLFEPGSNPADFLKMFSATNFPLADITPGHADASGARATMTLRQLMDQLDGHRRAVYAYLDGLSEAELQQRKARIPLFKQFMGTDEISIPMFVGAMLDYHWNDHAGQIGKIRKAVGLPESR